MTLTGETAIVTSGGPGIGESVSLKLAVCGVNISVRYSRSQAEAEHMAARCATLGVRSVAIRADADGSPRTRWRWPAASTSS